MKLFPNLERISIKEHAKSNNYEDYIGVVLDKRNNIFKVVEGRFTDKKDMYRKMKARGLILRKAYERKVWEWIEANADSVIISYLMLSTAFSKWRSNNVLHKYYEKLLNDIPELNREREKGNPNTRGGDFVTTDNKPAPKRQEESMELEEERKNYNTGEIHTVQLLGVKDVSEEFIKEETFSLPKDIIKKNFGLKNIYNEDLLKEIANYLTNFDAVKIVFEAEHLPKNNPVFMKIDSKKWRDLYDKYDIAKRNAPKEIKLTQNEKILNQYEPADYTIKFIGIKQDKTKLPFNKNDDPDKPAEVKMPVLLNNSGQLKDPVIVDVVYDYLVTKNIQRYLGVDYDYNLIQVMIDNELKKTYNKQSVESDKKEIEDGIVVYNIGENANISLQIDPILNYIRERLKRKYDGEKTRQDLSQLYKSLILKKKRAKNSYDINKISGTWQSKACNQLGNDSEESRIELSQNQNLLDFLSSLTADDTNLLDEFNEYIENNAVYGEIYSGSKNDKLHNTFYRSIKERKFDAFNKDQLRVIYKNIQEGKQLDDNEYKRKKILYNLIWYVEASGAQYKSTKKNWCQAFYDVCLLDAIDKTVECIESTKLTGFNDKTQNGTRDSEERVGELAKLRIKLENLLINAKENNIPVNIDNYKQYLLKKKQPVSRTSEQEKMAADYAKEWAQSNQENKERNLKISKPKEEIDIKLPKSVEVKITNYINDKYDKIISDRIQKEKEIVINNSLRRFANYEVSKMTGEDVDKNAEIEKIMKDDSKRKAIEKEYDDAGAFSEKVMADRKQWLLKNEYQNLITNEINDLKQRIEHEKDILSQTSKDSEETLYNKACDKITNEPTKESVQVTQYDNNGATLLNRYSPYQGKGFNYSPGPIKMIGQIVEDITKTELNPKLFEKDVLNPEVRDALYKIAIAFKDYLDLPFEIKDIYLTGSNANYNYTKDSDIDLHLVYDFEQAGVNAELLSKYLVAAKKDFNNKYDIKVKGMPVELGCENINEPLVSTGVYSLGANTWVIKPENAGIEIPDIDMNAFDDLSTQIDDTIKNQNALAIENLWKNIQSLRKNSLKDEGEFGMGNILFKKLRNDNYLEKLRNKMYDIQSKDLSLESSKNLDEAELNDTKDVSEYLKEINDELNNKETQDLFYNRSLIDYLDGYTDKNKKREVKDDKFLNEDLKRSAVKRALHYEENDIPSDLNNYLYFDLDNNLCRMEYKKNKLYKTPVKRQKSLTGTKSFKPIGPEEEITFDQMNDILNYDKNKDRFLDTTLYDDHSEVEKELRLYLAKEDRDFNNWVNENKDELGLDKIKSKSVIKELYNFSKKGISNKTLKNEIIKYYTESSNVITEADEKLSTSKPDDINKISQIFNALGLDPDYMTRYIYEYANEYDPKIRGNKEIEKLWKITGIDDISRCISEDGSLDLKKLSCKPDDVKIYMRDVTQTGRSNQNKSEPFKLRVLKNLIKSFPENDIEYDDEKLDKDIIQHSSQGGDRVRNNTQSTYELIKLTDDQIKKALSYVQSSEFLDELEKHLKILKKRIDQLDPKNENDKEEYYSCMREYNFIRRELIYLKFGGDSKSLNQLYDELTSTNKRGYDIIKFALNSVENGIKIFPKRLVNDPHGIGFYIKMPKEGHTIEEIKSHGSFDPQSVVKTVRKLSGGV